MRTELVSPATEQDVARLGALLAAGGLVAFPTETVYGLGADATNDAAVGAIFEAKGREGDNPLIVHFASADDIEKYAVIEDRALFDTLSEAFMPGPLTLVLPRRGALSARVSAGLDTVGVRVPSHPLARALIRAAGVPIAAPSANRSHRPSPTQAEHVWEDLNGRIDAILDGGACQHGVESTVLLLSDPLRILRPGAVTRAMIEEKTGRTVVIDRGVVSAVSEGERVASPGMKYRHYAPRAPLCAVVGEEEAVRAFFRARAEAGDGILCYEEDLAFLSGEHVVSLGARSDFAAQAQRLFAALRRFDSMQVSRIYTRLPDEEGLGLAVQNRLLRACEFCVFEV